MGEQLENAGAAADSPGLVRSAFAIVAVGAVLGLAYNAMGLVSEPRFGLSWIAADRFEQIDSLEDLTGADGANALPAGDGAAFTTNLSDPMAVAAAPPAGSDLPEIPELDRPIRIQLEAAKQFFDRSAAVFVDAREPDEYGEGHIPGSLSMPFEIVTSERERMENLDTGGRPLIVYCGGGSCELSLDLAWELLASGHLRVLVYEGGFPEWAEAGYPVTTGETGG